MRGCEEKAKVTIKHLQKEQESEMELETDWGEMHQTRDVARNSATKKSYGQNEGHHYISEKWQETQILFQFPLKLFC